MQRIRQLSTILGKVPAFAYLAAYVVLILLFSLIFYALPARHFRQSAASPELSPVQAETLILRDLVQEIQRTYLRNGVARDAGNGWHMRLDELDVPFITPRLPCCILIDLVIPIDHGSPGTNAVLQTALTVYTDDRYIMGDTVYLPFLMQYNSASPVEGVPTEIPPPGVQFSYELRGIATQIGSPAYQAYGPGISHQQQTVMPLSQALYDRIIAYGASTGDATSRQPQLPADALFQHGRGNVWRVGRTCTRLYAGHAASIRRGHRRGAAHWPVREQPCLRSWRKVEGYTADRGKAGSRAAKPEKKRPQSALRKPRTRTRERAPGDGACQGSSRGSPCKPADGGRTRLQ